MVRLGVFVSILAGSVLFAMQSVASDVHVSAVGRLERVDSASSCSAVLVQPDVVLTAAHCVAGEAGSEDALKRLRFRPGVGLVGPLYEAEEVIVHPLYDRVNDPWLWRLRFDFAVVRLRDAVPGDIARPMPTGREAVQGEKLFLVSWRPDGSVQPRQRACPVIPGLRGLVTLGCRVTGGESGAPLLRKGPDGLEIVAVLSSRSRIREQPVAQASNVALRLPPLLSELGR